MLGDDGWEMAGIEGCGNRNSPGGVDDDPGDGGDGKHLRTILLFYE